MLKMKNGCSLDEVPKFQRVLPNFQIVVYSPLSFHPIYTDRRYRGKPTINIMLDKNHFTAMSNVQAYYGSRYFCTECYTVSDTRVKHSCPYACTQCLSSPKCVQDSPSIPCTDCHRSFFGPECFQNHKNKAKSAKKTICEQLRNCSICFSLYLPGHECGKRKCSTCEKMVEKIGHKCYMPTYISKREGAMNMLFVYFDIESRQDTILSESENDKYRHIPNLLVSQSSCAICAGITDISIPCEGSV